VARVLAVVADLMLASRVEGSLRLAGHQVTVEASVPVATDADVIVADLDVADLQALVAADRPALGFYSHVDVDRRREAEAAGVDLVVPRSRMARELPELVERLTG
jgi:hypothetical protein